MTHALQAVIFDVDGTLADTERDGHRPAFNRRVQGVRTRLELGRPLYGSCLR